MTPWPPIFIPYMLHLVPLKSYVATYSYNYETLLDTCSLFNYKLQAHLACQSKLHIGITMIHITHHNQLFLEQCNGSISGTHDNHQTKNDQPAVLHVLQYELLTNAVTHRRRTISGAMKPALPKKLTAFCPSQSKVLMVSFTTVYMYCLPLNGPQSSLGCNLRTYRHVK